jgi:hypothetical protein
MSITTRQKQIVNPFASGYDYESRRNRFVIDAIHERYLYFFSYPEVGEVLNVSPSDNIENPEVTINDLNAYFTLYPQNGQVVNDKAEELSYDSQINSLRNLALQLRSRGYLEKYSSKTSEISYQESFVNDQEVANLVAIPPAHSKVYKDKLRQAFSLPKYQYNDDPSLSNIPFTPQVNSYMVSNTNVDIFDWRNNCLPGSNHNVYYNSVDEQYYYTARTDEADIDYMGGYDFNTLRVQSITGSAVPTWEETSQAGKQLYTELVSNALREILLATGKNSEENYSTITEKYLPPSRFRLYNNFDTRPGSRWTYAVKIDAEDVERLPQADSTAPSREEVELTPLQKARILTGYSRQQGSDVFNRSTRSVSFVVNDMLRYIAATREVIKDYDARVAVMGIRDFIGGVDFNREVDNLRSFFSLLSLFYNYNKVALTDDDRVEMFFTDDYQLDHVVINGTFYYQGTGTRTYLNVDTEYARVLSAFLIFSPTTFSLIENSKKIYEMAKITPTQDRPDVLNFMSDYVYPKPDLEKIKEQQALKVQTEKEQKIRRDKVFESFKRITQGNPRDFEVLYSNRPLRYSINSTLQNMDCDSGQAAAIGYALKFWQAAMGKTKLQSVIRQTIILLRDEVVDDELTKRRLTQSLQYVEDPRGANSAIRRDVNNYVNQQIACSLDVLGDFLENQFLDPLGLPPSAASLSVTSIDVIPAIDFKKCEMVGLKPTQSKIYQKMLEVVLMNWLKSLVAGLAKDFIRALLGCGPEDDEIELANAFRKEDYGFVNLLDYLDAVDLVEIAERVGLKDSSTTPPKEVDLEQITAFVEDVSYMVTPVELQQLLTGDASHDLILHIHETITGDQIIEITEPEIIDPDDEEIILFRRTRGLDGNEQITIKVVDTINPNVYNSINFTMDNIRLFFLSVGAAMQDALDGLGEAGFGSPLEAFCSKKDGFVNPITLNLSVPEIEAQYNDIVNSKIDKINQFCGWLRDLTNIESQLQRLIENLPILEYYNDLLQDIADISNAFADWLAKKFAQLFGEEQRTVQGTAYNLYNSKMGTELFYQIFWSLRELLIYQLYFSNGVTYFQTPAGFGSRVGYRVNVPGEDDWFADVAWDVRGNFGARRNRYTQENVYKFIWSDPRNNTRVAPPRLNLPQYRQPIVTSTDSRDAGYYSIPNSPPALRNSLGSLLSPTSLGLIAYGTQPSNEELQTVKAISERTYTYLKDQEDYAPYPGYTGATYLRCSNNAGGNIRTFFVNKPNTFPLISYYQPEAGFYNETSVSSSVSIPSENGDLTSVDYRIFNGATYTSGNVSYPIRIVTPNDLEILKVGDVFLPPMYTTKFIVSYANRSVGLAMSDDIRFDPTINNRSKNVLPISNYTKRIDSLIDDSVTSEIGRRRMPRYVSALNKPALQKSDDICITAQDLFKAESALKKIQSNFGTFFVNIMPMASAYPNWRSVGTIEVITDYLHRRLVKDLEDKELLGPFYTLIPFIEKVYPYSEDDPEFINNPPILKSLTPSENLKSIVRCVYVGMLDNIAQTSEYDQVNKSVFDPSTETYIRYRSLLKRLYEAMSVAADEYLPSQQLEQQDGLAQGRTRIAELYDREGPTPLGMMVGSYYYPVAFQIASYMMYMDQGIRYAERYSDTAYRLRIEEASMDDALLTAVKGQSTTKFLPRFSNFPVVVENYLAMAKTDVRNSSFINTHGPLYNPNYKKYLWDLTQRNPTFYNTTEVEARITSLEPLTNIPDLREYAQRLGRLSYSDQIPFFSRNERTGEWRFENSYFRHVLTIAFAAYVDGFGPDRRLNRPTLRTDGLRYGVEPLYWRVGQEDFRDEDRLDIGQFSQIVNSDQFSLTSLFRIAADLTSEDNPLLQPPANFQNQHALRAPHEFSRQGVPVRMGLDEEPRDVLNRFFTNYVNNRRGREEEDRRWEAIDSTYGDDHIGTELTPAGFFLATFLFNLRPPALGSIREEKRILEILINNDE